MRCALIVLALLTGCASSTAARLAEVAAAVNLGHMKDDTLPVEAQIIARDNWDAWCVQLEVLRGDPLPPDVEGRVSGD